MIELHLSPAAMLFALVACHFLADYPLQGDFLAQAKDRNTAVGKVFWRHALAAHAFIHGLFVAMVTGWVVLGLFEVVWHAVIDHAKCERRISLNTDQALHLLCKLVWFAIAMHWGRV